MSAKTSLPHIHTMHRKDFAHLISKGQINLACVTEKTDGWAFRFGYDDDGFWTQSSQSGQELMRSFSDYTDRAILRAMQTDKKTNIAAANTFGYIHSYLAFNKSLQKVLRELATQYGCVIVNGEIVWKQGLPVQSNTFKPVGTRYYADAVGNAGMFIVHTQMIEVETDKFFLDHIDTITSCPYINFSTDAIDTNRLPNTINLQSECRWFEGLDRDLIFSRKTKKNALQIDAERARLQYLQERTSDIVDDIFRIYELKPKWGPETEGWIVHPQLPWNFKDVGCTNQPRFKVTSETFRQHKEHTDGR